MINFVHKNSASVCSCPKNLKTAGPFQRGFWLAAEGLRPLKSFDSTPQRPVFMYFRNEKYFYFLNSCVRGNLGHG